jgi:folate-binding protein YgfZ
MNAPLTSTVAAQYAALTSGLGVAVLQDRTQIELTGNDRAKFLHNFCTNEINTRAGGEGCEAFLCDARGKIVGFVNVFVLQDSIVIDTVAGQNEFLLNHLDRYLIREDVQLVDRTHQWSVVLAAGIRANSVVTDLCRTQIPIAAWGSVRSQIGGHDVQLRRVPLTDEHSLQVVCDAEVTAAILSEFEAVGATICDPEAVDIARVEFGLPLYGRDVTTDNLPQELHRNATAISFTKGCYLGQETVARIDALGHVNQLLIGCRFEPSARPLAGMELAFDKKAVGQITSAIFSPAINAPLALAYVRREHAATGNQLHAPIGLATVIDLPVERPVGPKF